MMLESFFQTSFGESVMMWGCEKQLMGINIRTFKSTNPSPSARLERKIFLSNKTCVCLTFFLALFTLTFSNPEIIHFLMCMVIFWHSGYGVKFFMYKACILVCFNFIHVDTFSLWAEWDATLNCYNNFKGSF